LGCPKLARDNYNSNRSTITTNYASYDSLAFGSNLLFFIDMSISIKLGAAPTNPILQFPIFLVLYQAQDMPMVQYLFSKYKLWIF